ncbi:MAG: PIG-L family deacetylase [Candidatus Nanopelagicales bacterium]|nr:PIG-L family deacetylase [Candidatus Nanopelagicales bacterium]MDZ4248604.1 PIG-L family deacetylase [Candidatus Nanopelagicales bacterium]
MERSHDGDRLDRRSHLDLKLRLATWLRQHFRKRAQLATLLLVALSLVTVACSGTQANDPSAGPQAVLFITAHPDDETLFGLGRFAERGWTVDIALVTNGESGQVVEAIRKNPKSDGEVLLERPPGPGVRVVPNPPTGANGSTIESPVDLANERQREFTDSMGKQGVSRIFFLSDPAHPQFEDSWDNGTRNWDTALLQSELMKIVEQVKPDVIITLNPDELWAHPQHQGLGTVVQSMWQDDELNSRPGTRPALYGLREIGWYEKSQQPQPGDEQFDRSAYSPVLGKTYADYWTWATSSYVSQSSHPTWFAARASAGFLPGYGTVDVIRRLGDVPPAQTLTSLLDRYPPDSAMSDEPTTPEIGQVWKRTPTSE